MRLQGGRRSTNIEDRRGRRAGAGLKLSGAGAVLVIVIGLLMGQDPATILQAVLGGGGTSASTAGDEPYQPSAEEERLAEFVALVLGDTEDTWPAVMQSELQRPYRPPTLVMFTDAVQSACGTQSSAVGPFYCPADEKVYIDLDFYADLQDRFGAPGDFAQAYVIAHEVGHHIQNILGTSGEVHRRRQALPEGDANQLSVRLELQADCYAGVWAHHAERARDVLEAGDVEEGLNAAAAIGDDRLQRQATGRVVPESFTHGSSAQRVRWFERGLQTGSMASCDTFSTQNL